MVQGIATPAWVKNYTTAHVKLGEPINIGCTPHAKELQEMTVRWCANRERKNPVLNFNVFMLYYYKE